MAWAAVGYRRRAGRRQHTAGTKRCSHGVRRRDAGHAEAGRDKRSDRGQATTMKKWAREDEGGGVVLAVGSA